MSFKLKEIAYFSMVRSLLEYSCPVWDPYRQGYVDKLNKIQRAAARFVTNNYQRKSSVTALIQDLGWTDLQTRKKNFRLTSLYKSFNGLIAVPVSDLLTPADKRTRGGHKKSFEHIRANTTLGQNSFLYKTRGGSRPGHPGHVTRSYFSIHTNDIRSYYLHVQINSYNKIAPAEVEQFNLTITDWCVRIYLLLIDTCIHP